MIKPRVHEDVVNQAFAVLQRSASGPDYPHPHEATHALAIVAQSMDQFRRIEQEVRARCIRAERPRIGDGVLQGVVPTGELRRLFGWPEIPEPLDG